MYFSKALLESIINIFCRIDSLEDDLKDAEKDQERAEKDLDKAIKARDDGECDKK